MKTLSLTISALLLALSLGLLNRSFAGEIVRIHKSQITAKDIELKTNALETYRGEIIKIQDVRANKNEQRAASLLSRDLIELKDGKLISNEEIEFLLLEQKADQRIEALKRVPHADERVPYADE
jgi:hypothetical protein